jgi:hypothetical protein
MMKLLGRASRDIPPQQQGITKRFTGGPGAIPYAPPSRGLSQRFFALTKLL